jgi:biopolymer transport protein ExbD
MSFAMQTTSASPMSDINTTPLVDVMLVLLIIFMITAPLLAHKSVVPMPVTGNPPEQLPAIQTISMHSTDGVSLQMYWDNEPIDLAATKSRLVTVGALSPDAQSTIKIDADDNVNYQRVAEVLAAGNEAGIRKMGFDKEALRAPVGAYK